MSGTASSTRGRTPPLTARAPHRRRLGIGLPLATPVSAALGRVGRLQCHAIDPRWVGPRITRTPGVATGKGPPRYLRPACP